MATLNPSDSVALTQASLEQQRSSKLVDPTASSFDTFPSLSSVSSSSAAPLDGLGNGHAFRSAEPNLGAGAGVLPGSGLAAQSGHSVGSEGHLPPATLVTQDVTNPSSLPDPSAVQPGMSDPGLLDDSRAGPVAHYAGNAASSDPAVRALPPPSVGEDAKLAEHLSLVAADLKRQAGLMGATISAAVRTTPDQLKDTWTKLQAKGQEMKQNYQRKRSISQEQKRIEEVPVAPLD